ncbi:TRF2-interacting telomeric protein/Rap1 C terminal domain-containing protein [Aspergillus oleicola]
MASGQEGASDDDNGLADNGRGGLFQGMSFWLSHNVPQRSRFKQDIERNGGIVRLREKDADVQIVDHKKKNLPPNVYSFQFIEKSVDMGILQDLEDYRAGPSTSRPVGATHIPTKGQRSSYTIEEDQILWDYMHPLERDSHVPIQGNKIYQEFAEKHPSHPWQSWRDRYLKRVRGRPRPGGSTPPSTTTTTTTAEGVRRSFHSRASSSNPPSSRPAQMTAQRTQPSPKPQEKKRKRSPEPTERSERAENSITNTNLRRPTSRPGEQRPSEVVVPPDSLIEGRRQKSPMMDERTPKMVQQRSPTKHALPQVVVPSPTPPVPRRRESPRREVPQSPVKGEATTKQTPEIPATPDKPAEQAREKATAQEPTVEANADIENSFWELPSLPSSPASSASSQEAEEGLKQDIDAWIEDRLSNGKGTEEQIIEAIQCTSMDPQLADKVLESLVAGKGIPTDMRGVWTAEDDEYLEAQDSRDVQHVLEKHGDLFKSRWEYLQMVKEAQRSV